MKYLFGPVNSRRLGLSLGIDLLLSKTCTLDCIYCEVGRTVIHSCQRQEYTPTADIIKEIDEFLAQGDTAKPVDVFTITATGEPTLHSGLGLIINHIKEHTGKPVAILTNGTLLHRADVRAELMAADVVIPSLDSAREESFRRIDRPAHCVELERVIAGTRQFCQEFSGQVWLEVLISKGINDSAADIEALARAIEEIKPQRVQLNTVVRPPLEDYAAPLTGQELDDIAGQLPGNVEIIASFAKRDRQNFRAPDQGEILEMLRRRPCPAADIGEALNYQPAAIATFMAKLAEQGEVVSHTFQGKTYYQPPPSPDQEKAAQVKDCPCQKNNG
ncbi:MAG: radical SAM protein [Thermodesulfobacteriota bacterium]